MFHLYSVDGVLYNIPLESLRSDEKINRPGKVYRPRNVIDKSHVSQYGSGEGDSLSAVKAYNDAVKITNEREPVLHAYTIMKSPVITVDPEMSITDAWGFMQEKKVNHVPVLSNEKKIIGILSYKDFLSLICFNKIETGNSDVKTVNDIMAKKVITAGRVTDIRRIARVMFEHHIGTMPVVDDNDALIGIITRSDILYALITYPPLSLWV